MAIERIKMTLVGVRPLLMHSGNLANPFAPVTQELKAMTSKRKKTDDDLLKIRKLEWFGGLYLDENRHPALTEEQVVKAGVEGARKNKLGKQASAAILTDRAFFPLEYKGPRDLEALYADERFVDYRPVGVSASKVMRARPRFNEWRCPIEVLYDTTVVRREEVVDAYRNAGMLVGLGDWRPKFGRFEVEAVK
jgi:hypothetical protein